MWDCDNGVFLYLACNVTYSDFFKDQDLEKMLTFAIDRVTINEKFYRGNGKVQKFKLREMSKELFPNVK